MRPLATLLPFFVLACSGGNFDVGAAGDASESDSTDLSDSSGADGGSDAVEEACVKNECGGCTTLVGKVGDACVTCGGKLACKGTDKLECDSAGPKNKCGGCTTLTVDEGTPCGVCMTGKYTCDSTETTKCVDPVTGPAPMTTCGTCSTKKVICDATAAGGTRCEAEDANKCGGCGDLVPALGSNCGVCGTITCDPMGTSTKCDDPLATSMPKVGDACGTCKTSKYLCGSDRKSLTCAKADDTNGCGGCAPAVVSPAPGSACGFCGGTNVCAGTSSTKCSDSNPVPLATLCGICKFSKHVCVAGTTTCATPDERTDNKDVLSTTGGNPIYTLENGKLYGVSFVTPRIGSITGFTFEIFRFDATSSAEDGTFRVRLIKGAPTSSPAIADILATFNVPPVSITPTGSGGPHALSFTLPAPTAIYPAATPMFVEFTYSSFKYNFSISAASAPMPSLVDVLIGGDPGSPYTVNKSLDTPLTIRMTGCY